MDAKIRIYPHNDLLNLAWYHLDVIRNKKSHGQTEGISLDAMSCIIAMAFSIEALLNFVGVRRVANWKERLSYEKKFRTVLEALGFDMRWDQEPFRSLRELKELRDQMAHGKPREIDLTNVDDQSLSALLQNPWDDYLEPEYVESAYGQVVIFETQLLRHARIQAEHAITRGTTKSATKHAGGIAIEKKRQITQERLSSARSRKPPRSIGLDAAAISMALKKAVDEVVSKTASSTCNGPSLRKRFPRPS